MSFIKRILIMAFGEMVRIFHVDGYIMQIQQECIRELDNVILRIHFDEFGRRIFLR